MARRPRQMELLSTSDLAKLESERDFQSRVIDAARLRGYIVYSIPDSRRATLAGWPDLTLIRKSDRRLVFAELKREKGRVSESQATVLDTLRALETVEVYVWRPSEWAEILRILG